MSADEFIDIEIDAPTTAVTKHAKAVVVGYQVGEGGGLHLSAFSPSAKTVGSASADENLDMFLQAPRSPFRQVFVYAFWNVGSIHRKNCLIAAN